MNKLPWHPHARFWERAALFLCVLVAFALRAYHLGALAIWWDESLSVYRATRGLAAILSNTILIQKTVTYDTLPPFYFVLLHFLIPPFGTSEFALRYLSLMASVATVPLLYVLGCRMIPFAYSNREITSAAVIAAFLAALAPFYVWYGQEARPYALVLFLSTLAVYALLRAFGMNLAQVASRRSEARPREPGRVLRPAENSPAQPSRAWLALYVFSAAAALYTHYYALFLIPFHVVLIAIFVRPWPRKRIWVLLPALPLGAAVFLIPLAAASLAGNAGAGPYFVPLDVILRDLFNSFSIGVTMDAADAWWIDLVLFFLFALGVLGFWISDFRGSSVPAGFGLVILAYIFVPVLGVFIASFIRPLYQNSRYLIGISPAFYLGVAAGIVMLARRWKLLALPAVSVFLVGAAVSLNQLYFDPAYAKDDHRAWAEYLRENVHPGDFLILDSPHTEELFRYYAQDRVPWISLPVKSAESPDVDRTAVREAYRLHTRVWFLAMDVSFDDPDARIERLLNENGVLLNRLNFTATSTELSLSLFVPALPVTDLSQIAHPLDIGFAGHLRLRGYAAPPSIAAGGRDTVQLFWQVDAPVGEDYAVSLRAADSADRIIAQWDRAPLGNRAGTTTWPTGMILADLHDLPIPANTRPGLYRLQVVPYHAATGAALGDVVTLGEINITGVQ